MRHKLFLKSDDINLYEDAFAMYSLREVFDWTNAVIQLRRTNDNATTNVFFDSNGEISLNSLTGSSFTVPTATTLGTWVGGNSATVFRWHRMKYDNLFDINDSLVQSAALQPIFITSGVINLKNGKPSIVFNGSNNYLYKNLGYYSELNSGNTFTTSIVAYSNLSNSISGIFETHITNTPNNWRLNTYLDCRTSINSVGSLIRADGVNYITAALTPITTLNQRLQTFVKTSSNISYYNNNLFQNISLWSGTYNNTSFHLGVLSTFTSYLNGGIQEIIMYPSDKTSDLDAIHTDINDYYNIY